MTKEEWKNLIKVHALRVSQATTPEQIKAAVAAAQQVERLAALEGVNLKEDQEQEEEIESVYDLPAYERTLAIAKYGLP